MSKLLALFLATVVAGSALTGCLGGSDDGDSGADDGGTGADGDDGGDTGGTGGDGTDGDGGAGGDGGDGGDGNQTAPKPANVNETGTLSVAGGINVIPESPAPAQGTTTFTLANAEWVTFQVTITPTEMNADKVTVKVLDPEGNEAASADFAYTPGGLPPAQTVDVIVSGSPSGDYTINGMAGTIASSAKFDLQYVVTY